MADEDLSPDLEDLKAEIEKSAGVDEETKESLPTTDSIPGESDNSKGVAMNKAKEAMAGVAAAADGLKNDDDEEGGNEDEIALDDVEDDSDATKTETADEPVVAESGIDYDSHEPPEPEEEPEVAKKTITITEEMRAEARDQFGIAQRVASMLPAEYETWLFPCVGDPGFHEGQVTLARVINNLTSAGYNKDSLGYDAIIYPKVVQIAGATWSQTNYAGGDVVTTREQLTLAPASQVVDLLPSLDTVTHDIMSPAFPTVDSVEIEIEEVPQKSFMGPALVGVASLAAIIMPVMLVRRSSNKV
jgi:hypothetical protein